MHSLSLSASLSLWRTQIVNHKEHTKCYGWKKQCAQKIVRPPDKRTQFTWNTFVLAEIFDVLIEMPCAFLIYHHMPVSGAVFINKCFNLSSSNKRARERVANSICSTHSMQQNDRKMQQPKSATKPIASGRSVTFLNFAAPETNRPTRFVCAPWHIHSSAATLCPAAIRLLVFDFDQSVWLH